MVEPFDVHVVISNFSRALLDEDDVQLVEYIDAYSELNKMFPLLGSVFSFVQTDVREKVTILRDLHASHTDSYHSVKQMTTTECGVASAGTSPRGSRTLLRLHRALEFLIAFVTAVRESEKETKMAALCRDAYKRTLAKHHPWIVRQSVHLASYTLSSRHALIRSICGTSEVDDSHIHTTLSLLINAAENVYNRVEMLYTRLNILKLE